MNPTPDQLQKLQELVQAIEILTKTDGFWLSIKLPNGSRCAFHLSQGTPVGHRVIKQFTKQRKDVLEALK